MEKINTCDYCGKKIRGERVIYQAADKTRYYLHKKCKERLKKIAKRNKCSMLDAMEL